MNIVLYHNAIIPPLAYGGTERVIYWLAKGLVHLGHQVTLISREGSFIPGIHHIGLNPKNQAAWQIMIPAQTDIVHLHATPLEFPRQPFLITIHGNGQPGERFHSNTVFLSMRHAANHGSKYFVYNGIDPADYFSAGGITDGTVEDGIREEYLVFLAKASWKVKNLKGAIEVARAARLPLEIMGNQPFSLGSLIAKLLALAGLRRQLSYHGMANDEMKQKILKKAKGLLFPVRWHEPFGLAVLEALASGCPVFGTPYGALPEIITPKTGFLSDKSSALVEAIKNHSFSSKDCRARVTEKFTHLHMAQNYLNYYDEILRHGKLDHGAKPDDEKNSEVLTETLGVAADKNKLLPWYS